MSTIIRGRDVNLDDDDFSRSSAPAASILASEGRTREDSFFHENSRCYISRAGAKRRYQKEDDSAADAGFKLVVN